MRPPSSATDVNAGGPSIDSIRSTRSPSDCSRARDVHDLLPLIAQRARRLCRVGRRLGRDPGALWPARDHCRRRSGYRGAARSRTVSRDEPFGPGDADRDLRGHRRSLDGAERPERDIGTRSRTGALRAARRRRTAPRNTRARSVERCTAFQPLDVAFAEVFAERDRCGDRARRGARRARAARDRRARTSGSPEICTTRSSSSSSRSACRSRRREQRRPDRSANGSMQPWTVSTASSGRSATRSFACLVARRRRGACATRCCGSRDKHRDELGFVPRIAFHGPVDASVPEAVSSEVLQVLGEGLWNVARHARASSVEVVVSVEGGWLSLSVADDGIGIADGPHAGQRRAQHGDSGDQSRRHLLRLSPRADRDDHRLAGANLTTSLPQIGPVRGLELLLAFPTGLRPSPSGRGSAPERERPRRSRCTTRSRATSRGRPGLPRRAPVPR